MRIRQTWVSALLALAACGCMGRGDVDLLEARLRQQEDSLFAIESQLTDRDAEILAVRRERDSLRSQLAGRGEDVILPEQAQVLFRAEAIKIDPLLTGGLDYDGLPGDELLTTVLTPVDADGDLLKLPGAIQLELLDLSMPAGRQQIGNWEFTAEDGRQRWHSGPFGSGYVFKLPWQRPPENSELTLHAKMTTADGRTFDTRQVINITPPTEEPFPVPRPVDAIRPASSRIPQLIPTLDEPAIDPAFREPAPFPDTERHEIPPDGLETSDSFTDETIPRFR